MSTTIQGSYYEEALFNMVHVDRAAKWLRTLRETVPKIDPHFYQDTAAYGILNHPNVPEWYFSLGVVQNTVANRARVIMFPKEIYGAFKEFDRLEPNDKLPYAMKALIGQIVENIDELSDLKLPKRLDNISVIEWLKLKMDSESGLGDCVEADVRWDIERAWRARGDYKTVGSKDDKFALHWIATSLACLEAVYSTVKSLDEVEDLRRFKSICNKIHENMIIFKLWDGDSTKPDRANPDGSPKPFHEVSKDLEELYVLLALSTIGGIIRYKTLEKQRGDKKAA